MTHEEIMQKIVNGELTIKQALEQASEQPVPNETTHRLAKYIGKNIFTRTVTHHYTGKLVGLSDGFITLVDAAWIADDGRFNETMARGTLSEVEPYPDGLEVDIAIGALLDICEWKFELPRRVK